MKEDCIFCQIVEKTLEASIIYEDELICCFLDIDPINEGHILIIPKEHVLDIDELDEKVLNHMMKFIVHMKTHLNKIYDFDGYTIMQNGGIFNDTGHFHLHLFPRYKNDGFKWISHDYEEKLSLNEVKNKIIKDLKI